MASSERSPMAGLSPGRSPMADLTSRLLPEGPETEHPRPAGIPEAERPFFEKRGWEKVTVDKKKRMWLNGESLQQMEHAEAIKAAGGVSLNPEDGNDTSKDQAWPHEPNCRVKCADKYVLITTILWLGPKIVVLALPMLILHLPPMIVVRLTIATVPDGTERIKRTSGFYALFTLTLVLSLPAIEF
ncbi:unnamed protein product [Prorocentrum cordatum]|uniref:Uncharacterized protein n=1 Tax=Prorocentrum cordatum TaxID=2364126 RepID=A0ABN9R1W2_9DINO|nr:unnamed protein product [Polarella glacialis]